MSVYPLKTLNDATDDGGHPVGSRFWRPGHFINRFTDFAAVMLFTMANGRKHLYPAVGYQPARRGYYYGMNWYSYEMRGPTWAIPFQIQW